MKKPGILLIIASLFFIGGFAAACDNGQGAITTPTNTPTDPVDKVEVNFFYESDNCFCLDLAVEWVDTIMSEDYGDKITSGELVYNKYDYRDPAHQAKRDEFKAPKFALFITTIHGEETNTWQVGRIWMYTDTSGTNEMLKQRFFNEVSRNMDLAFGGED